MYTKDKLLFHEDDYNQIEIIARENFFGVTKSISEIPNQLQERAVEHGFGQIYSREQIIFPLERKRILKEDFYAVLKEESDTFFGKIFKGYSSYEELINNSEGFGYENYVILYVYDNGIILSCWIVYKRLSETLNIYPAHLKKALEKIGTKWNLLLVDWNELVLTDLTKSDSLESYISILYSS